jgi:hypothetical protein
VKWSRTVLLDFLDVAGDLALVLHGFLAVVEAEDKRRISIRRKPLRILLFFASVLYGTVLRSRLGAI